MTPKFFLLPLALAAGIHAQATLNSNADIGLHILGTGYQSSLETNVNKGGINMLYQGSGARGFGFVVPTSDGVRLGTDVGAIRLGPGPADWLVVQSGLSTFSGDVKVPGKLLIGTAGWSIKAPDFVFAPDYKLQPLREVEAYVKKNRHLPGIASASEMESGKSVDLVQMNLDLLKKVEELTLHVIEQNKKIEAIQKTTGSKI
ncbi:MAG: hypothetical protein IPK50_09920 [Fibrobacterota bacterium]|nr:MAG: hypothetical protein IPK50_09920 [Fibrobacterota bacterium]